MATKNKNDDCFIIMPIGDSEDHDNGHFLHVYDNIIKPACERSEVNPIRADDVKETNLIHLDILQKLIDSPIAICDLSTRNPNVLFELGIRQAFDKPVVLIQEKGTEKIFDITPLRYLEYDKDMKYHDVLNSQNELKAAIGATRKADGITGNVNSIVKLLALSNSAAIPNLEDNNREMFAFEILQSEIREMRHMMEMVAKNGSGKYKGSISTVEYERISNKVDQVSNSRRVPFEKKRDELRRLMREAEELMMTAREDSEHMIFRNLMERISRALEDVA